MSDQSAVVRSRIRDASADRNFVVVGSGAAGLVGAVTAHAMGLRPIVIEKAGV